MVGIKCQGKPRKTAGNPTTINRNRNVQDKRRMERKGAQAVYICSGTKSPATRKGLMPEPNTGTDSVN